MNQPGQANSTQETVEAVPTAAQRPTNDWGLASLLLGGILLLMAPLLLSALALAFQAWRYGGLAGFVMFLAGELCMFPLYLTAIGAGLLGLRAARKHDSSSALALTGIVTSLIAALLWLFVVIHAIATVASIS